MLLVTVRTKSHRSGIVWSCSSRNIVFLEFLDIKNRFSMKKYTGHSGAVAYKILFLTQWRFNSKCSEALLLSGDLHDVAFCSEVLVGASR